MATHTLTELKESLLAWAAGFDYAVFLDSCQTDIDRYGEYEFILGVADQEAETCQTWEEVEEKIGHGPPAWWFGSLTYGARTEFEPNLKEENPAAIPFPKLVFFQAETVIYQRRGSETIESFPDIALHLAEGRKLPELEVNPEGPLKSNFSANEYQETVEALRQHIFEGDCYEINLCQLFHTKADISSPAALWARLTAVSPTPFASFARFRETYLMGASPERFLQLSGDRLITQPIKGTTRRSADPDEDKQLSERLRNSEKEQAENVMIVDLSRNDLYRSSTVDGVEVPHLFEVQSFAKVHHLVSTIQAQLASEISPLEAIANTFPPGSMTGAPKFRTCELIDQFERHARGMYAGSVGYFAPDGNFDLNVVIRSMVWHAPSKVLTYHMGGAITWDSDPLAEYEETLIKARAIQEVLSGFSYIGGL